MHQYDLIADWYGKDRTTRTGVPETLAMAGRLSSGARILDVGCGNGLPITRALLDAGHHVVGLDSSGEMLARFRRNLPATACVRGLVQAPAFADGAFDAAVAWGVIFHLPHAEQSRAFASVSRVLKAGAPFLFTAGDVDDHGVGIDGTMNGVEFPYFSFSVDGYRALLSTQGLALIDVHVDAGRNTYYLTRKAG